MNRSDLKGPDGTEPGKISIQEMNYEMTGITAAVLEFDHTTDDEIYTCSGTNYVDFRDSGGFVDPDSAGGTGDIVMTTVGAAAATDSFTISFHLKLKN